ncbi:hypothetical protein RZS08_22240, partial [Arthrospira platensis SPKY1]|nr:hypothetical protein [Arthrospira platensis SPKY1]
LGGSGVGDWGLVTGDWLSRPDKKLTVLFTFIVGVNLSFKHTNIITTAPLEEGGRGENFNCSPNSACYFRILIHINLIELEL